MPSRRAFCVLVCTCLVLSGAMTACRVARDRELKSDPLVAHQGAVVRAAFDMGSSTTKLRVAPLTLRDLDVETGDELTGGNEAAKVDFESDLARAPIGHFGEDVQRQAITAVKRLKQYAQELGAREFVGVATGVFRRAENADAFLARLRRATGVSVQVVTPDEEAQLGFLAVQHQWKFVSHRLVLWDIGADGTSLTYTDGAGNLQTFRSSMASATLRDRIIRLVQGKPARVTSPNPMSPADVEAALKLVRDEVRDSVPLALQQKLQQSFEVVGIGSVHNLSLLGQIGRRYTYGPAGIRRALAAVTGKTDGEIGGQYADTQVVNLILVLGFLEVLGIEEVKTVHVNVADGMLRSAKYWNPNLR